MEERRTFQRVIVLVVDSFGIGRAADAHEYGDKGADTYGHIVQYFSDHQKTLHLDSMRSLGLDVLTGQAKDHEKGICCRLKERSSGKDTITGHWEMMGIRTTRPFVTFTDTGFPDELISELERISGHTVIGNKAASGTDILRELGEEELASHSEKMIVYTSADSVLQICGHEQSMGLAELYRVCDLARKLTLDEKWRVGRVIARPYTGFDKDSFERTPNRKDLALDPPADTVLDILAQHGLDVIGIGKISDIFNGRGITKSLHSQSSVHGMKQTLQELKNDFTGLLFVNLVDFDAKWGHRRDPAGYGHELEAFDEQLGLVMEQMKEDDLLLVTADHGNDPTWHGTDHTREQVPLLIYSKAMRTARRLNDQESFAVVGATILDNFGLEKPEELIGTSLLEQILAQ